MDKIILCRTAWMKYYEGHANIDIPRSGAKYIKKHKTGGEINNFKNRGGNVYCYFPNIVYPNLNNLESNNAGDDLKNVTVVFCAKHPTEGGVRVVGWYKKAILYSEPKSHPFLDWVHAEAKFSNVHLIPENDRVFYLPDTFGRSSLFYFTRHPERKKLQECLKKYISSNGKIENYKPKIKNNSRKGKAYQQDIEKRLLVEQKAVDFAKAYYKNRYGKKNVKSVETENKGWDLEVKSKYVKLNIEVKGLSGYVLNVELTPNEFKAFDKCANNYQLFIANRALTKKPIIRIFKYQSKGKIWVANDKSVLHRIIRKSAVLSLR